MLDQEKQRVKEVLRLPYIKIETLARDVYGDDASTNTKRMRLKSRINNDTLSNQELEVIGKILKLI